MNKGWAARAAGMLCIAGVLAGLPARAQTSARPDSGGGSMIMIPGNGESAATAASNAAGVNVIVIGSPNGARAANRGTADSSGAVPAASPTADRLADSPPLHSQSAPVAPRTIKVRLAPAQDANSITPVIGQPARTGAPAAVAPVAAMPVPAPVGNQDPEALRALAAQFLTQQSAGLPGKVVISVAQSFTRGLAACAELTPFLPPGARLWGRTTVGVRCTGAKPWTLYLQARVALNGTYYVAGRAIAPGETIGTADLLARDGDLSVLPQAIVTDPSQAVGTIATARITAGLPLRQDLLRSANAVQAGQSVKLVAQGTGFSISAEGSALSSASAGQPIRVKTAGGQIVSGVVNGDGTVEVKL